MMNKIPANSHRKYLQDLIEYFRTNLLSTSLPPFFFQNQLYPVKLDEMKADLGILDQITPTKLEELYLASISTSATDDTLVHGVMTTSYPIALLMVIFAVDQYLISKTNRANQITNSSKKPIAFLDFMQIYLSTSPSQKRKGLIESWRLHLLTATLLDPCVGGGVFLLAVLNYFIFLLLVINFISTHSQVESDAFLTICRAIMSANEIDQYIRSEIKQYTREFQRELLNSILLFLKNRVYCSDINSDALEITRIRLQARLLVLFSPDFHSEIAQLILHSQHTDFLTTYTRSKPFQIILGNPPYISADNLTQILPLEKRQALREMYAEVVQPSQKLDIFFYFFKKSVDLVENAGIITFIIPNRILTNSYAQRLREFLLEAGMILILINFAADLPVFQSVNVHPCIILFQKKPLILHKNYYSSEIKELSALARTNLYNIAPTGWQNISLSLVQRYKLFFTNISLLSQDLLLKSARLPQIQSIVNIREATRRAHFAKRLKLIIGSNPSLQSLSLQVTIEEWQQLPRTVQCYYASEVRGTHIHDFQLHPPKIKTLHPDLLSYYISGKDKTKTSPPFTNPMVFLRELGDHLHGVLIKPSTVPHLGYGGVYYYRVEDLDLSFGSEIDSHLRLSALLIYLCSDIVATFYRLLFHTGAWGGALKYRSSYLARLPLIPFNIPLFGYLGLYLTEYHQKITQYRIEHRMDALEGRIICHIEEIIHLLLLYRLFIHFPFPYLPVAPSIGKEEEMLLDSFQSFNKSKEMIEEIEKILNNFLSTPQICAIKIWIAAHPWMEIFPSIRKRSQ